MQLEPQAVEAGVRLLALGTVGSTNKEALTRARAGEHGPLWITATSQSEGRGRMARKWNSPPGNLYASLLLSEPAPFAQAPELAFVAALAARDAVIAQAPAFAADLAFKWPNDLLLDGKKCAGILIEGETTGDSGVHIVVGIGINCTSHPSETSYPATDLATNGAAVTAEQLFQGLSGTMCTRLAQWDRGSGFAGIVEDWRNAARGIGEYITVRNGAGEKHGRFAGLDPAGRLILELSGGGIEKISAGDIFPLQPRV